MRKCLPVFFIFSFACELQAQEFGGNPSSVKWRQINTKATKIIYPNGLDSIANRVATITELLDKDYSATIGNQHRKVSIVLQANNTLSNAYVGLAPFRSEFYLTPPQNPFQLGSLRWADNLAIHEFRHVVQYNNFNKGLSKFFSVILGEQGQAFANALTIPDWFFEGDAVWNETAFTRQGRGRLPENFNGYKSLFLQKKDYSFMKLRNGSFKNYVPNHYDLGYLLVAYGREKYGDNIWQKITDDAARFKGVFYPLQKAVKKHTGINYKLFTNEAFNFFQKQWASDKIKDEKVKWLTGIEKNDIINYKYPYPSADGIIVLKRSNRQIPVFVFIDANGNESKIAVRDIANDDYYSYKNGKIIYTAYKPDIRWGNRDYSVIRVLDIFTKNVSTISTQSKYYSPDISDDGQQIVVVDADPAKSCFLQILDQDGKKIKSLAADSGLFYSHPKFTGDGKQIVVAARQTNGNMGWLLFDIPGNTYTWLLKPSNQIIGFPVIRGDTLYYSGTATTTDALYSLSLTNKANPELLADYSSGIYQGFVKDGRITGSMFTANGYRIGELSKAVNQGNRSYLSDLYVPVSLANKTHVTDVATNQYTSSKYHKANRLLNFHSWQPEISESEYSVSLLGENVLSTLYSELYYTYNRNENSHKAGAVARFGGWYVQPYIDGSKTWHREVALNTDTTLQYNQNNATIGLYLPLNLSFGKSYRSLTFNGAFSNENIRWTGFAKDKYRNFDFTYFTTRAVYTSQVQKAVQQIYPRFAHSLVAQYQISANKKEAWQWLLNGSIYLPGLFRNQSLVLTGAYQARDTMQNYIYSNSFTFSRGYRDVNFPRMFRLGINYHLPLVYPDWGFGNILYFQRIRMNAFYDYTSGKSLQTNTSFPFSTAGTELYFDTKWWNQLPVTVGVRYSRLLNNEFRGVTNPNQWEIILPVNLLPR
ncbi:MAG: hypothetical protein V4717_23235 [Bacteroidota bacterium]